MPFSFDPEQLPRPADQEMAERHRERWLEAMEAHDGRKLAAFARKSLSDPSSSALLEAIFGNSPYLSQSLIAEPELLPGLFAHGADATFATILADVRRAVRPTSNMTSAMRGLRRAKRRAALLIGLADIADVWNLKQVCAALSRLADTCLSLSAAFLLRQAHKSGNLVLRHKNRPERDSGLVILGVGKLGANELNYSSDIDLIVLYDPEKTEYRGSRSVQEMFVAMTRELVRLMAEFTEDGYVFRTDLRLRPDPASIPLAISLEAAESYYESVGQNWERAALIKARPVAGDIAAGSAFLDFIKRFIWRKNLDFAAIHDIHSIKRQINAHHGGAKIAVSGHDIKVGRGGIREIEFFAQTQQLIWGGRDPSLRSPRTLEALAALAAAGHLEQRVVEEMSESYHFLRKLEHRMQMIDDRQTQTLPTDPQKLGALAIFMGFPGPAQFDAGLRRVLRTVESHYARLFEDAPPLSPRGNLVFTGTEDDPATLHTLTAMGFAEPSSVCARIRAWHHGHIRATRSAHARELLTEMTPTLLDSLAKSAEPDAAFQRFDHFLTGLPSGIQIFSLFHSNPGLLDLVGEIMGDAPRLAESLSDKTALLDAVLSRDFYLPPDPLPALTADLEAMLEEAADDFEEMLDAARRWADEQRFRVGVQTLRVLLTPEAAAGHLTDIAEATLRCLFPRVEREFVLLHGNFKGRGAALVALGKMGSREMTATSDLDLILIYDLPGENESSDGTRPLAPSVYYARLTQRLIAALTARTAEGLLYEVDMRLRPSGNSGPLATSLDAFRAYQRKEAWTWEHMALTRARAVAGTAAMRRAVGATIRDTLRRARDPDKLLIDVADMRERIATEFRNPAPWDVKYRRGGLVDIDFIAQYIALRWAHQYPALLGTDTASILEHAGQLGVIAEKDGKLLQRALHLWNAVQQVLRQTVAGEFDENKAPGRLKEVLAKASGCADFAELKNRLENDAASVFALYEKLIGWPARSIVTAKEKAP